MTREEFGTIIAYLSAGVGKEFTRHQAEVYFDLLGDLPLPALQLAAKRALLESKYPTLPTVGTLRELATDGAVGSSQLTAAEAWRMASKHAGTLCCPYDFIGRERTADVQKRVLASLPPEVRRCGEAIGWREIAKTDDPDITRAHFLKAFETVSGRQRREALMPANVKALAASVLKALPAN